MKIRDAYQISDDIVDTFFALLEQKNITNYQISQKCAITEAALSYIKNHKTKPKLCTLIMIAQTFQVNLSEIINTCIKKE